MTLFRRQSFFLRTKNTIFNQIFSVVKCYKKCLELRPKKKDFPSLRDSPNKTHSRSNLLFQCLKSALKPGLHQTPR